MNNEKEIRESLEQTAKDYCMDVKDVTRIYERVGFEGIYTELEKILEAERH